MTLCAFIGPTVTLDDAMAVCPALYWPPVRQGDVYRVVTRHKPRAIGIVDGFFGGAASVWHKEILWALSEGVAVFGSASMGALRAAELHAFGMRGVGHVFDAYRDGRIEDDDEVALAHAPAEFGYTPLSEPMVNIRETLARAVRDSILGPASAEGLTRIAKALHFPDRQWRTILAEARRRHPAANDIDGFDGWLPGGRVDIKRLDAVAMLAALAAPDAAPPPRPVFEPTAFWHALTARIDAQAPVEEDDEQVLDELRLEAGATWRRVRQAALLRWASDPPAPRDTRPESRTDVAAAIDRLRADHGLHSQAAFADWLASHGLDQDALSGLAARSVRRDAFVGAAATSLAMPMLDELRMSGDYVRLAARSDDKHAQLARLGALDAPPDPYPQRLAARLWFIRKRMGLSGNDDPVGTIRTLGFTDVARFDRVLQLERVYLTILARSEQK